MIKHSKPEIGNRKEILKNINKILDNRYFSQGYFVGLFEKKLAAFFKRKYAVCVSSGTSALHLGLVSLNVKSGDEVIVPAYSCSAILNAVLYVGAKPVIIDVDKNDFNMRYDEVEKNISSKTKAIIVPHMFGYPARDIERIVKLGVFVIEDTTQSIGSFVCRKMAGGFGIMNIISFYATKMITSFGEGGVVLIDDEAVYKSILDLREYDKKSDYTLRYNYKMSEVSAIMGISQLKKMNFYIEKRKKISDYYFSGLKDKDLIFHLPYENTNPVFYRFILGVKKGDINKIISSYLKYNIEVKKPVGITLDKYYYGRYLCKNSKFLFDSSISLPIYPSLTQKEIEYIIEISKKIL